MKYGNTYHAYFYIFKITPIKLAKKYSNKSKFQNS